MHLGSDSTTLTASVKESPPQQDNDIPTPPLSNHTQHADYNFIYNGNRTKWSPIQSVVMQVINNMRRPQSECLICLLRV